MLNDSPCAERPADGDNKVKDLLGELRALAEQARYEADQVADGFETLTESQQNKLTIVVQNLHRIILYSKDILFAMKHKQP